MGHTTHHHRLPSINVYTYLCIIASMHLSKIYQVNSNVASRLRGDQKGRLKHVLPIGRAPNSWNERRLCLLHVPWTTHLKQTRSEKYDSSPNSKEKHSLQQLLGISIYTYLVPDQFVLVRRFEGLVWCHIWSRLEPHQKRPLLRSSSLPCVLLRQLASSIAPVAAFGV